MSKTLTQSGVLTIVAATLLFLAGCGSGAPESNFPVPGNVTNFSGNGGDTQVNFQTDMSISDIESYYKDALTAQGLTERTITTVSTDVTLNLVMDGYTDDKSVVVQATVLPTGGTNVNVRAENL